MSGGSSSLSRWEDGSGLEHACGICGMKANNPNAKQKCFGEHGEPCYRYHQVIHFIGASHKCKACINLDEVHDKRHEEIAQLVDRLRVLLEVADDWTGKTRSHSEDNQDVDDSEVVVDQQSSSISSSDRIESQIISVADKRKAKREAKRHREIQKARRSEAKHAISCGRGLINEVATAIHGAEQNYEDSDDPLAYLNLLIQRNIGFVANQQDHRRALLKAAAMERDLIDKRKLMRRRSVSDVPQTPTSLPKDVVPQILDRLGIGIQHNTTTTTPRQAGFNTPGHDKKQVAALTERIFSLIAEDVHKHRNEQKETENRAAGFWRYANSEILERIRRARKQYDWKTGAVLDGNKRTQSDATDTGSDELAQVEDREEREDESDDHGVDDKAAPEGVAEQNGDQEAPTPTIPPALQNVTNNNNTSPGAVAHSAPRRAPVLTLNIRPVVQQPVGEDADVGEWTVVQKKRASRR